MADTAWTPVYKIRVSDVAEVADLNDSWRQGELFN